MLSHLVIFKSSFMVLLPLLFLSSLANFLTDSRHSANIYWSFEFVRAGIYAKVLSYRIDYLVICGRCLHTMILHQFNWCFMLNGRGSLHLNKVHSTPFVADCAKTIQTVKVSGSQCRHLFLCSAFCREQNMRA